MTCRAVLRQFHSSVPAGTDQSRSAPDSQVSITSRLSREIVDGEHLAV